MRGNVFEYKKDGVTFTIEFDLDREGELEEMMVFVGDSPNIISFLSDDVISELEEKVFEHLPEKDYEEDFQNENDH